MSNLKPPEPLSNDMCDEYGGMDVGSSNRNVFIAKKRPRNKDPGDTNRKIRKTGSGDFPSAHSRSYGWKEMPVRRKSDVPVNYSRKKVVERSTNDTNWSNMVQPPPPSANKFGSTTVSSIVSSTKNPFRIKQKEKRVSERAEAKSNPSGTHDKKSEELELEDFEFSLKLSGGSSKGRNPPRRINPPPNTAAKNHQSKKTNSRKKKRSNEYYDYADLQKRVENQEEIIQKQNITIGKLERMIKANYGDIVDGKDDLDSQWNKQKELEKKVDFLTEREKERHLKKHINEKLISLEKRILEMEKENKKEQPTQNSNKVTRHLKGLENRMASVEKWKSERAKKLKNKNIRVSRIEKGFADFRKNVKTEMKKMKIQGGDWGSEEGIYTTLEKEKVKQLAKTVCIQFSAFSCMSKRLKRVEEKIDQNQVEKEGNLNESGCSLL